MMRSKWRRYLPLLIGLLVLFGIYRVGTFNIKTIEIDTHNARCVSVEQLSQDKLLVGQNIFTVDQDRIWADWSNRFPCVGKVELQKSYPNKITVQLYPKMAFAQIVPLKEEPLPTLSNNEASPSSATALLDWSIPSATGQAVLIADRMGVIFDDQLTLPLPVIFYPRDELKIGESLDYQLFTKIVMIIEKLTEMGSPVSSVKVYHQAMIVQSDQRIAFNLGDPQLPFSDQINRQLASLQLILQKAKIDGRTMERIDLRFDKPVVVYSNPKKT